MSHYFNGFTQDIECKRCVGNGWIPRRWGFNSRVQLTEEDCPDCCGHGWRSADVDEPIYPADFADRFWSKVDKGGPDDCWIWKGGVVGTGYGMVKLPRSRKMKVASRVSLEIKMGRFLHRFELACHTCDTPLCVNPAHLFVGSNSDNMADASAKDRIHRWNGARSGSQNPRAKLDESQALAIKFDERIHRLIAVDYGVSETTVTNIKNGRVWAHLPDERPMTQDEIDDAAADAFSDMCEGEPPISAAERHQIAAEQKRRLRS